MEKSPEAFRTISEVAEWLDTPAHVLRFWESRFSQIKPVKRAGGRRYYRPSDMALLGGIKKLLHEDGMTIRGVQKILRTEGVRHVAALSPPIDDLRPGDLEATESVAAPPPPVEAPAGEVAAADAHAATVAASARNEGPAQPELDLAPAVEAAAPPDVPPGMAPDVPPEPEASPLLHAPAGEADGPAETAPPPGATEADRPADAADAVPAPTFDPARLPPFPEDDDPAFAAPAGPFPLADPRAARARLAADPARAAALHARLVALAGRMRQAR
jgi:DNA-binding transcriptional MerR regulator